MLHIAPTQDWRTLERSASRDQQIDRVDYTIMIGPLDIASEVVVKNWWLISSIRSAGLWSIPGENAS